MKKIILFLVIILSFSINSFSQTTDSQMNPVLEYQTGTWCQWCPCAHTIINAILSNYPNTIVIAYHGNSGSATDPWDSFSSGIRPMFGWSGFPQGTIGRKSGNLDRSAWNNRIISENFLTPGVTISVTNKNYNPTTRTFTCNVDMTARAHLDGNYSVNFILTEDNIVYSQTGNSSCAGASVYYHEHVVKKMINGDLGEGVITSGHWMMGATVSKPLSCVLPSGLVPENCNINIFVYKAGTSISNDYDIQQALSFPVTDVTGIGNNNTVVDNYSLSQNYPNPFNPVTNITYSIPKDGNVTFRVYDMLGNEIGTYVNGFQKSGSYTVTFDGANLASGIYYYKLEAGSFSETKKMTLIK